MQDMKYLEEEGNPLLFGRGGGGEFSFVNGIIQLFLKSSYWSKMFVGKFTNNVRFIRLNLPNNICIFIWFFEE